MAAAVYSTDLTDLVADSASTNNWAATGGGASGLNVETDYFIEGTRCISKNAWASDVKGMLEDTTNNTLSTGSGNAVYTWVTHHTPAELGTKAQGGIRIALGSTGAVYNTYYYAGSDTIDYGAPWICAVVDPDNATADSGTVTVANMDCYGAEANLPTGGPTKGSPFGIDEIRYGRSIRINDGVGASATCTGLAAENDAQTNRWGQFQRTPGSTTNFTLQARLQFGVAAKAEFVDSDKTINIADLEFVAATFIEFDVTQASDITFTGMTLLAVKDANTKGNWVTTSAGTVTWTSSRFVNMGTFDLDNSYTATGCTFQYTQQITLGGATITGGAIDDANITANTGAVTGSITELNLVTGATFTRGTTGHAAEVTGVGTINWNNDLSGYRAGATGTTTTSFGDEAIYLKATSGSVIVSVADGASIPSIRTDGATVDVQAGNKDFKFTVSPSITGYEWRAYTLSVAGDFESTKTDIDGQESATADNQTLTHGFTSQAIAIQIIPVEEGYEEVIRYFTLTAVDSLDNVIILPLDINA